MLKKPCSVCHSKCRDNVYRNMHPVNEYRYSSTHSLTSVLDGVGG